MKKTLITLLAFCGVTMAASDFSSSITTGTTTGNGNYYGFTLSLTDTFVNTTFTNQDYLELPQLLQLDAITLYTRTDSVSIQRTPYLAIYEYSEDGTTGTFVGISTNNPDAKVANTEFTFNFSDVTLSSTKQYQMLFVNSTSTATNVDTYDEYKEHGVNVCISVLQQSSLPSGDALYKGTDISSKEGTYLPKLTITTSAVPEPATATLSLLALAGLAARRRRR